MDVVFELVFEFVDWGWFVIVIIKYVNFCGVVMGDLFWDVYLSVFCCDFVSVFGGIVVFNCMFDVVVVEEIFKVFMEVVIVLGVEDVVMVLFFEKKNLCFLLMDGMVDMLEFGLVVCMVFGGLFV